MTTGTALGLAAVLRGWDDERLAGLLLARPDLARPAPAGVEALAARAVSGPSVGALLPDLSVGDVQAARAVLDGVPPTSRLADLALAWDERGPVLAAPLAREVERATLGEPRPEPPTAPVGTVSDDAAGAAAAHVVSLVDELAWRLDQQPPRVLRTGGLPAADLRRLARALDVDEPTGALLLAVAHGARLVGQAGEDDAVWAPSGELDEWRLLAPADRWVALAAAWLDLREAPHLVGTPATHGKGTVTALSPDTAWAPMRMLRRHVLDELASLDGAPTAADLLARVRWRHPFVRVAGHEQVVAAVLAEASTLGVVSGGLSTPGRALVAGHDGQAAALVAPLLPAPAERVLLGADLTAVVPGLLDGDLAALLRACADVESRGGASVHRFTPASVQRALDAGWTPELLRERLAAVAGELPQALGYLIDDAGRRHAALLLGGASAYLRCEDPATLAALAGDPRLALRVLAPTVAVSALAPTALLGRLRASGRSPAVESPDGRVAVVGAAPLRSPVRRRPTRRAPLAPSEAADVVARLRAGAPAAAPEEVGEPGLVRALLAEAAAAGATVRVDYVGPGGVPVVVDLAPTAVEAGRVRGTVDGAERVVPLARISRVRA